MFSLKQLSPTITDMIRFDHSHVMVTFHQYTKDKAPSVKKALAETICTALEIHATLEEEMFYPVMRQLDKGEPFVHKAEPEHNDMRRIISELRRTSGSDPRHDKLILELMRDVIHHVADEETTLLPQAETLMSKQRLSELGAQMTKRRMELVAPKAGKLAKSHAVGFSGSTAAMVVGAASALLALRTLVKKPSMPGTNRTWKHANSTPGQ
ncbi:hemerythrin domain-containing protein [Massilia sp. IC2-278]|uniref:hemerythrin domain-containing protein n=1 Tax=Massilia sp. IC2-278 TaxID=2887200 RepID=UPI001E3EE2B1|nr:hemerythrin domain-containing protein [Massilia sp. IC2-278]MCC2959569.1 hemerythrin domain-containing protein [Massilia sp. IC2-278]